MLPSMIDSLLLPFVPKSTHRINHTVDDAKRILGTTLIELLFCVALIATLTTITISSLAKYQAQQDIRNVSQQFFYGLQKGLNISLLNRQALILTPLHHQESQLNHSLMSNHLLAAQSWQEGWSLFVYDETKLVSEQMFSLSHLLSSFHFINTNGSIEVTYQSSLNKQYVLFYSSGEIWPYGRFVFCHKQTQIGYEITISQWGNLNLIKTSNRCHH